MAVPSNTVQTFAMVGIKEDVSDIITLTDPMEVPVYSGISKGTRKSRTPEWMIDSIADPNPNNKTIEGDDATNDAGSQPVRHKNVVQLFDKVVQVSTTSQAVDTYGRGDELNYQVLKAGKALKRDIEARITGNFASVLGAAGTAGECAGIPAFLTSNVSRGATGASGGYQTGTGLINAATDGTLRTVTETLFKDTIALAAIRGGKPDTIMVNAQMKQKISASFTGIATQYNQLNQSGQNTIVASADVYKSDFGLHKIVFNRFIGHGGGSRDNTWTNKARTVQATANRDVLILDMGTWKLDFLQAMKTVDLAKTGHSDRKMISCELTLECSDEARNAILADVQTT